MYSICHFTVSVAKKFLKFFGLGGKRKSGSLPLKGLDAKVVGDGKFAQLDDLVKEYCSYSIVETNGVKYFKWITDREELIAP